MVYNLFIIKIKLEDFKLGLIPARTVKLRESLSHPAGHLLPPAG